LLKINIPQSMVHAHQAKWLHNVVVTARRNKDFSTWNKAGRDTDYKVKV
jgi:hypothetical protein